MTTIQVKTHAVESCPGCGGTVLHPLPHGRHMLQQCEACGLISAPEYADPEDLYVDGYLFGETNFGLDATDLRLQPMIEYCAGVRMDMVERVIRPPGRFLDVGCGTGDVLAAARDRGWETQGVEPVAKAARFATEKRGVEVRPALLQDSGLPEQSYNVVAAFHVLEHIPDGLGFVRMMARWARPGGYIVIEVPNWQSHQRRSAFDRWRHLRPLEHVAHHSPETLTATTRRAGLEPVLVASPSFLFAGQALDQQLLNLGLGRWKHWARPLLGHTRPHHGAAAVLPHAAGRRILKGIERLWDRRGAGAVVLVIARAP